MKHLSHVSKTMPLAAAYTPPTSIWDVGSWSDIVVGIGLVLEKKVQDWLSPFTQ